MKVIHAAKLFTLLVLVLVLVGCQASPESTKYKIYDVKGKVVIVDLPNSSVTLDHEDIPGLMKAMRMKFTVDNPKALEALQPGDQVDGKLKVKGTQYLITDLQKR